MRENQSYGQWSPEMRAVATMEAMQLCTIPQAEKQNYEVVLFASTIPLTADNLLIPQELQGVQLLVDKAGNVIGIAARVGVTGMLAPGLIMSNAVKWTIETPPQGYTQQDMMNMSAQGWQKINVMDINSPEEVITDANGQEVARVKVNTDEEALEAEGNPHFNNYQA